MLFRTYTLRYLKNTCLKKKMLKQYRLFNFRKRSWEGGEKYSIYFLKAFSRELCGKENKYNLFCTRENNYVNENIGNTGF